jgi:hypothetical protein
MMAEKAVQESANEVYATYKRAEKGEPFLVPPAGMSSRFRAPLPGIGLDYAPDVDSSAALIPDYWDVNTCPLFHLHHRILYHRSPYDKLRSDRGLECSHAMSKVRFGLWTEGVYASTKEQGADQLRSKFDKLRHRPDLTLGGCTFQKVKKKDDCGIFGRWNNDDMFYSPQAGGYLPPTFATCTNMTGEPFNRLCEDVRGWDTTYPVKKLLAGTFIRQSYAQRLFGKDMIVAIPIGDDCSEAWTWQEKVSPLLFLLGSAALLIRKLSKPGRA